MKRSRREVELVGIELEIGGEEVRAEGGLRRKQWGDKQAVEEGDHVVKVG